MSNSNCVVNLSENSDETNEKLTTCTSLKNYILEFCENTSIHGLKFLCERNRSIFERIWWLIVISLSLFTCITCILQIYYKWTTSPVIVSFATSQTSIRDIPFPAVTICPDVKSIKNKYNYSETYNKIQLNETIDPEEAKKFSYLNLICERQQYFENNSTKITDEAALNFITHVANPVGELIPSVTWRGVKYTYTGQFFTPIVNSEGVCYTFNILDKKDLFTDVTTYEKNFYSNGNSSNWTIEDGFGKYYPERYPRSALVSGTDGGIEIALRVHDDNIDYNCNSNFVGFKITLQHPALIPRGKKQYFTVPLNQSILAAVKPIMMKTSKSLIDSDPQTRQCFFAHEKKLMFYKQYAQPNCLFECLTNFTLDTCGCVGFYMPKQRGTPICGSGNNNCVTNARGFVVVRVVVHGLNVVLTSMYLSENIRPGGTSGEPPVTYAKHCNCLPTCTSLDFEVELSQSDWNWEKCYTYNNTKSMRVSLSRLRIFFKDMQFITSARNELYNITDFIANCGGLLGLFMGFSTISLFEVFYFVTLRLFCNLRRGTDGLCFGKEQFNKNV